MPFIEAYSVPGATTSINGQSVSVITFNGVKRSFVEVSGIGPQGPKGEKGDKGDKGDQGDPATDAHYVHEQMIAASTWNITHNLNKHPSVTVVTSANDEVEGGLSYPTLNTVQLTFSAAFAGKAYLN